MTTRNCCDNNSQGWRAGSEAQSSLGYKVTSWRRRRLWEKRGPQGRIPSGAGITELREPRERTRRRSPEGTPHCELSTHPNPGSLPPQTGTAYPSMVRGKWRGNDTPASCQGQMWLCAQGPRGSSFPGLGLNTHKGRSPHPAACP